MFCSSNSHAWFFICLEWSPIMYFLRDLSRPPTITMSCPIGLSQTPTCISFPCFSLVTPCDLEVLQGEDGYPSLKSPYTKSLPRDLVYRRCARIFVTLSYKKDNQVRKWPLGIMLCSSFSPQIQKIPPRLFPSLVSTLSFPPLCN